MDYKKEINKRRTFGIISHPDAGKTTLTEKLLLFGGAIQSAGAVKNNKIKKSATSDFMEIEKQRGISVATSVMAFNYRNRQINILDTPGHKDFAEDTYRTLTAVDSVIMVIDCANGVEAQTEKLMEVCRMRDTPVIVFINKMDREGQDAFDLLDEIESKLLIKVKPMSWPIGIGATFKGVYNIHKKELNLFSGNKTGIEKEVYKIDGLKDPKLPDFIEVDITPLKIGSKLYITELQNEDYTFLHPDNTVVMQVRRSRLAVVDEEEEGEDEEGATTEEGAAEAPAAEAAQE